jgi:hypothetical protein
MEGLTRGQLTRTTWCCCGSCSDSGMISEERGETGTQAAKRQGYRYTKKLGWVCPKCLRDRKTS